VSVSYVGNDTVANGRLSGIQVVTEIGNLSIEVIGNEVPDSTGLRFPCGRLS